MQPHPHSSMDHHSLNNSHSPLSALNSTGLTQTYDQHLNLTDNSLSNPSSHPINLSPANSHSFQGHQTPPMTQNSFQLAHHNSNNNYPPQPAYNSEPHLPNPTISPQTQLMLDQRMQQIQLTHNQRLHQLRSVNDKKPAQQNFSAHDKKLTDSAKIEKDRSELIINKIKHKMSSTALVGSVGGTTAGLHGNTTGNSKDGSNSKISAKNIKLKSSQLNKLTCDDLQHDNVVISKYNLKNNLSVVDQANVTVVPDKKFKPLEDPAQYDNERERQINLAKQEKFQEQLKLHQQQTLNAAAYGAGFMNFGARYGSGMPRILPTHQPGNQVPNPTPVTTADQNQNLNTGSLSGSTNLNSLQPNLQNYEASLTENNGLLKVDDSLPVLKPDDLNFLNTEPNKTQSRITTNDSDLGRSEVEKEIPTKKIAAHPAAETNSLKPLEYPQIPSNQLPQMQQNLLQQHQQQQQQNYLQNIMLHQQQHQANYKAMQLALLQQQQLAFNPYLNVNAYNYQMNYLHNLQAAQAAAAQCSAQQTANAISNQAQIERMKYEQDAQKKS